MLVQVPYLSLYLLRLQLLLHFGVQGQLFIFLQFNGRCRLRLRQHPLHILEILSSVRHLIFLSHPLRRVPCPRDHLHRPTTRLSALNQSAPSPAPPRKKRVAVKKGWKGRVEGSPPPSEKLINLDAPVLQQQRRTHSGKNFDAIGVGKESWVSLA